MNNKDIQKQLVESVDEECYLETENHEEDNEVAEKNVEFAVLQC